MMSKHSTFLFSFIHIGVNNDVLKALFYKLFADHWVAHLALRPVLAPSKVLLALS